jgi:hypothetical protein
MSPADPSRARSLGAPVCANVPLDWRSNVRRNVPPSGNQVGNPGHTHEDRADHCQLPFELERQIRKRLDALGPAPRAKLLRVLMLPDFDRAERIGEFWGNPKG